MATLPRVGDEIEFNSDPEDEHNYDHNYYGKIININKARKQIKIKRTDNNQYFTYFIDEIIIQTNKHQNKDRIERIGWKLGSKVQVYSEEANKWFNGEIIRIFNDNEGEWLVVRYAFGMKTKEVGRFTKFVKPCSHNNGY